jgi:glutamine phosphoribosylpyrophosphate amidotransferase
MTGTDVRQQKETLTRLLIESKIRGLHAFGFSALCGSEIITKKFLDFELFLQSVEKTDFDSLIAHCRYSTSGDYLNPENNQPIVKPNSALVFNGVIHMGTKQEYELEYNRTYETENDGEIMLCKILDNEQPEKFLSQMKGSFAGLYFLNNRLFAGRNPRRPAWLGKKGGTTFICSTKNIFDRTGVTFDSVSELPPNKFWQID